GGMGIRELRRIARQTGLSESVTALLLEVAAASGLLDDDQEAEPRWLPTTGFDTWKDADLATRWIRLVTGWLAMPRQPGLVGQRDDRDKVINVLSGEVERSAAATLRRSALRCLAALGVGAAPTADDILERLRWQAPRRS